MTHDKESLFSLLFGISYGSTLAEHVPERFYCRAQTAPSQDTTEEAQLRKLIFPLALFRQAQYVQHLQFGIPVIASTIQASNLLKCSTGYHS